MKAYRKIKGEIREIRVDVSPSGNPLLPPNTTVDPRPEPLEGHYLDIVGDKWEQIPIYVHTPSLKEVKDKAIEALTVYRDWLFDSPVEFEGHRFDSDETARIRVLGAVNAYQVSGTWPHVWVTYDNTLFPLEYPELLNRLSMRIYDAFTSRFFFITSIREQIYACETIEEVELISIPEIGYVPPIPESEEEEGSEEGVEEPPLEDEGGVGTGDEGEGDSESNEEEEDPVDPEESEEEEGDPVDPEEE